MTTNSSIYNKVEFTITGDDVRFLEFGKDLLGLIKQYEGNLVGYLAEDITKDEVLCEDAGCSQAEACIQQVYGLG